MESVVNAYGAALGETLSAARGEFLYTTDGRRYFDMFSSAGAANFGHNHPEVRRGLIEYLEQSGVVHGLDYFTVAKRRFMERFETLILPESQRGRYRYYFAPPAGTLAMEAAIKYARRATGRQEVGCFTNSFHGLTYNALSATGNVNKRRSGYTPLAAVARLPYQGYFGPALDYPELYRQLLTDESAGYGLPAAMIFETVQAEGGMNCCDGAWYEAVLRLCREQGIVSIVDDIQAGCGRTGSFFSFTRLSAEFPDIICLSKSLSGFGLPIALVLVRRELDVLDPGENSGTFRGNNLGVQGGALMLDIFASQACQERVATNEALLADFVAVVRDVCVVRGRGLIYGLDLGDVGRAALLQGRLRQAGILIEGCGGRPQVAKIMPPLVSDPGELDAALRTVAVAVREVCSP